MNKGNRKEYNLFSNKVVALKNYTYLYAHNQGSSNVLLGGINIAPSEIHIINTNGVLVNEEITIDFDGNTNNKLFMYAILATECN